MTLYTTQAAMTARFGEDELIQLTDHEGAGTISAPRVAEAIATASSLIDGYLAARHTLPLTEAPAWLASACQDLARNLLWRSTPPESVKAAADAAMRKLKDVAAGILRLDDGVPREAARPGAILPSGPDRVFSRETLKNF